MKKEMLEAEKFRQMVFITQAEQCRFISCWCGNIIGEGHNEQAMVKASVDHLRIRGVKHPVVVNIDLNNKRKVSVK